MYFQRLSKKNYKYQYILKCLKWKLMKTEGGPSTGRSKKIVSVRTKGVKNRLQRVLYIGEAAFRV